MLAAHTFVIVWVASAVAFSQVAAASNPCSAAFATAAEAGLDLQVQALPTQSLIDTSLKVSDLPFARPKQPWPFRNLSTALEARYPTTDNATGVTYSRLHHAPIKNVTSGLLLWWFRQDLERVVPYPWDGGNYTRYQIWHPRDHCHQKTLSQMTWLLQEFIIASKNFTRRDFQGFNASTEAQINLQMRVNSLNIKGLSMAFVFSGVELTKLQHTWKSTPKGVDVVTESWIGNPTLSAAINKAVNCGFSRGEDALVVARKLQQHTVEEFGNLEKVLPYIYSIRNLG